MMPLYRLGCPMSLKTPNMGNPGFYDALYLELAKRESAELATLDGALGRVAIAEGVPLSVT